jgi:hypothetical protein
LDGCIAALGVPDTKRIEEWRNSFEIQRQREWNKWREEDAKIRDEERALGSLSARARASRPKRVPQMTTAETIFAARRAISELGPSLARRALRPTAPTTTARVLGDERRYGTRADDPDGDGERQQAAEKRPWEMEVAIPYSQRRQKHNRIPPAMAYWKTDKQVQIAVAQPDKTVNFYKQAINSGGRGPPAYAASPSESFITMETPSCMVVPI